MKTYHVKLKPVEDGPTVKVRASSPARAMVLAAEQNPNFIPEYAEHPASQEYLDYGDVCKFCYEPCAGEDFGGIDEDVGELCKSCVKHLEEEAAQQSAST